MNSRAGDGRRRVISLGSLYMKYFWLIAGSMALLIVITVFTISTISARSQVEVLDEESVQSLTMLQTSLDTTFGDAITQAYKLTYLDDVVYMRQLDRDYTYDYDALSARLRVLRYLRLTQRAYLDYNIALYTGVNDYVISTNAGAQKRQHVYDSEIASIYERYWELGKSQFFLRRSVPVRPSDGASKLALSYFYGVGPSDFLVIDMDIEQLELLTGGAADVGGVKLVLDDEGYLFGGDDSWENIDYSDLVKKESDEAGSVDFLADGNMYRAYVCHSNVAQMTYVLLVPYEARQMKTNDLIRSMLIVLMAALVISIFLALIISKRVFRPIGVILDVIMNKGNGTPDRSGSDEVEFILFNILRAYQQNSLLEKEQMQAYEQMRSARVRALQQQMTPHFLYNTLQAILWMTFEDMGNRKSRSSESIKSLSEMARFCMEAGTVEVKLKEEIAYVEDYLELMKLRYGEKIRWSISVADDAAEAMVPRVSIQPLVENAVRHSLCHMENGHLEIKADLSAGALHVCVRDNGLGMTDEDMALLRREFEKEFTLNDRHIALLNLNQRLKLIYGSRAGLYIERRDGMLEVGFVIR